MNTPRKLAAILAADMAGYSRLMGLDEAGTAKALREHRAAIDPILAAHGGRVFKTTGDGVLVEFPSIVGAVESALAVQKLMAERNTGVPEDRRMLFRIGINLGDVLIEGDDILGDGVNVAARLEGIAEPGGICVSEDTYRQTRGKVDTEFIDVGEQSLKNITRPVRVYRVRLGVAAESPPMLPRPRKLSIEQELSIIVLPFSNLSSGPKGDYFADGLTNEVTTHLSYFRNSFIISRNTAFTYKNKPVDIRQVGRDMGVRYALQGSIRRSRTTVRVDVQMSDTETGAELWADTFDRSVGDVLLLQSDIASRIARSLDVAIFDAASRRVIKAGNPDVVDLIIRGWNTAYKPLNVTNTRLALELFERALKLDPMSHRALVGLALQHVRNVINVWAKDKEYELKCAEAALNQALALMPDDADAHYVKGLLHRAQEKPELSIIEYRAAIDLNPSLAPAYAQVGQSYIRLGQSEKTFDFIERALRLSPRDPNRGTWLFVRGAAHAYLGNYEQAIESLHLSIQANPEHQWPHLFLAAAYALSGNQTEAEETGRGLRRLAPDYSIQTYRNFAQPRNQRYAEQVERICEGLQRAGMAEG